MTDKTSRGSPSERCFYFTSLPAIWKYAVPSEKSTRCWYAPRCCSAVGCADHGVPTLWDGSLACSPGCEVIARKSDLKNPASAPCIRDYIPQQACVLSFL